MRKVIMINPIGYHLHKGDSLSQQPINTARFSSSFHNWWGKPSLMLLVLFWNIFLHSFQQLKFGKYLLFFFLDCIINVLIKVYHFTSIILLNSTNYNSYSELHSNPYSVNLPIPWNLSSVLLFLLASNIICIKFKVIIFIFLVAG